MADNHDYIALDWVRGEIEQTLSQARVALEAFVENKDDTTQMTFCLNYIHQVHGTLQMVEFYGAALLAEEMEKLCQSILDDKVSILEEALEALMEALLQLENYLDHIQTGQRDLPVILLPILNDLRALQGQPLLSDTSMFTPDLSAALIEASSAHNVRMQDEKVVANLRKLRQMFQFSLAGIIRNQDLASNFDYLHKVLARLEKFCHGTPIGKLWWVAIGYLDAIQDSSVGLSSAPKQLLRELDHYIKLMIDESATILSKPVPTDLLKNLLYYVAKTEATSERIGELREVFSLAAALPSEKEVDEEREKLQGPGRETMASVVDVLSEELSQVKDQLDLFVRGDHHSSEGLTNLVPSLSQVANTMAVLGLGVARKQVLDQVTKIEEIASRVEPVSEQELMDMAGALLYVEANLAGFAGAKDAATELDGSEDEFVVPAEQFESAHNAVITESRNGLEQAKNSIVGFIASQWDHSEIEEVPDLLDSIRGGLQIIPLPKAAELLKACAQYIRSEILDEKAVPDWNQLDRLADAITSIEYYIERLAEGASENDRILKVAEESVAKLGYGAEGGVAEEPVVSEHHTSEVAAESPDAIAKETDEGLIDEEILEIFIEEVSEVMSDISQAMTQLHSQDDNFDALKELRRAFHTLKGSGRLVGAESIGELAWSVENMLNRYLERSTMIGLDVFDLLDAVVDRLPVMTDDFAKQQESTKYEHLIARAEQLTEHVMDGQAGESLASSVVEPQTIAEPEPEPEPVESVADDDDDLIDDEILEIFIEEAEEVLETISNYLPALLAEFDNQEALTELRRAFHTLKGSGRMVGAEDIGETAWAIENMMNRVIDGSSSMNQDMADLISYVVELIPGLIENFKSRTKPTVDLSVIETQAEALSKGESVAPLSSIISGGSDQATVEESVGEASIEIEEPLVEETLVEEADIATSDLAQTDESVDAEVNIEALAEMGLDKELLEIFESEASGHINAVEEFIVGVGTGQAKPIDDALSRALHTLKGSANTANIQPIALIAVPVEKFIKEARANGVDVNAQMADILQRAVEMIQQGIRQIYSAPQKTLPDTDAFLADLKALHKTVLADVADDAELVVEAAQDPQLINIFLTEGLDILLDSEKILNEWSQNPVSGESLGMLISEVKTLHKGAKLAGLESIAELCECLEDCYGSIDLDNTLPDERFIADIKLGHDALIDMMDQVAAGLTAVPDNKLLAELREHVMPEKPAMLTSDQQTEEQEAATQEDNELTDKLEELEKELDEVLPSYTVESEESEEALLPEIDEGVLASDDEAEGILDPELADIFLDEAREIIHSIGPALERIKEEGSSEHVLVQLQRDLHTLKGGARLANVKEVGDLSHILELVFERLVGQSGQASTLLLELLDDAEQILSQMLGAIENQQACPSAALLISRLEEMLSQPMALEEEDSSADAQEETQELAPEPIQESAEASVSSEVVSLADLDPELVEIFMEEARDIIDSSGELLHEWENDPQNLDIVGRLQRELHTLKGGARMAEIASIGDLSHELETLFEKIVESQFNASSDMAGLCLACHDALAGMVEAISEGRAITPANDLLAQIKQLVETGETASVANDTNQVQDEQIPEEPAMEDVAGVELEGDLLPLFLDESKDILAAAAEYLEHWRDDEDGIEGVLELQREMHTLKGGARLADVDAIADLAHAVEERLTHLLDGEVSDYKLLQAAVTKAYQEMTEMLERLIHGETVMAAPQLVSELLAAGGREKPKAQQGETASSTADAIDFNEVDEEVLEMFMEEASELIDALEEQILAWSEAPTEDTPNREIQRVLHTLKGGARLSNLDQLADESHDLETLLIQALRSQTPFEGEFKDSVVAKQDVLIKLVEDVQKLVNSAAAPAPTQPDVNLAETAKAKQGTPVAKKSTDKGPDIKVPAKDPAKLAAKAGSQETIRVSAGLMEELVNLAGETSISRGRLEQQISDFAFTLEEMTATIERLREQLRRLEMETEAQVLFSAEKEGLTTEYEDFDPLEMDRYSSIQQLSRALTESTTDLLELRETLSERSKDAETLLLQQSRINSELQEGLMKTRMIPFSSMVPRLRRIVRQISGELNKKIDFDVMNAEGEMDRSIMERMVAPLEHMLRNALDHGIESADAREKAGKSDTGSIILSLSREGGDVVLKMKDDGAGINDDIVLNKAIKQGLVKKNAKLSRHEILQLIMLPGFSTAEKITQISGRGVGMDVVASEIKQMGGSIAIDSTLGEGTEFTVRLPFTVSVNRALMVNTGEDFYAIPLNTIEGIVRVSPYELEEYYKPDAPMYEYAGRKYKLQYLGKLLHSSHHPKLQGQPLPLPVILVRGTDQPMALQVDSLMGSREIVVKSLGAQFGSVHGVSGATILGDGSVVVILDLPALIRDESAGLLDVADEVDTAVIEEERAKLVMVVDDSVTVRKVTTRLLERHGMDVITAKDGVDAIAQLQDHKPDVMLLDIEMPRMDGFEVATLVRHDERLKDVPIIMITSRTGQKHRERALSIGVNEYLGKPFQEPDLLENIERLTGGS